jgi:N-acetylmuramoyl-L-alanine amidase CwlA
MYHKNWNGKHCPHRLLDNGVKVEDFRKAAQIKFDEMYKEKPIMKDNTPNPWAKDAVEWATKNGILLGDENGNYKLHSNCTKEDVLVFLHRALKK